MKQKQIYKNKSKQFVKIDYELTKKKVAFGLYIGIVALVLLAFFIFYTGQEPWLQSETVPPRTIKDLKYFTLLSNIFMGGAAIMMIVVLAQNIWGKRKEIHKGYMIANLTMTTSVAITMMTVILFLLPVVLVNADDKTLTASKIIGGSQMFFHIVNPLLSIIAFVSLVNTQKIKLVETLYALIPMFLYSIFYMSTALTHINPQTGRPYPEYDWYGFCQFGMQFIPLVLVVMYGGSFLFAWLLWLGNRKIKTQIVHFEYFLNILVVLMGFGASVWLAYIKNTPDKWKWAIMWLTSWSVWVVTLASFIYLIFMVLRSTKVLKGIPIGIQIMKLACVALVFFNGVFEVLFNWPFKEGPRCFDNQNHFFHLLVPFVSAISYMLVERNQRIQLKHIFFSMIPYFAYFAFYWIVNYMNMDGPWHWPEGDWDWYLLLHTKWWSVPICFIGAPCLGFFMGWVLWICNRKIHIGLPKAPLLFQKGKPIRK